MRSDMAYRPAMGFLTHSIVHSVFILARSCRSLWIVAQVEGTGHQTYQVSETAVTYWVNRWEPPAIGGDPPSLPPSGDLEIFRKYRSCNRR